MNIKGKIVTLRAIEREDMELLRGMLNDPELEGKVVGWSFPVSKVAQEKWYERTLNDNRNLRFIITTENDGAIGLATLTNIDWKNRTATHGIKLFKKEVRSKGIGTDTVMSIMRYAFDELQLHKLEGSWLPYNIPSKNMYMKLGWTVEGIKRECIFKNGKYHDLEIVGILKDDYYTILNKTNYWETEG